jgi:hypothetical protein
MKYIKLIKDLTHLHQGTLILIKEGTLLQKEFSIEGICHEILYRPCGYKTDIGIAESIIQKNPNFFVEVTETEWLRENRYNQIFDYILELDPCINWQDLISTIQMRFIQRGDAPSDDQIRDFLDKMKKEISPQPIPQYPHYPTYPGVVDNTRCPGCGNLIGSPCWNTACPNRLQIWCSTNTGNTH